MCETDSVLPQSFWFEIVVVTVTSTSAFFLASSSNSGQISRNDSACAVSYISNSHTEKEYTNFKAQHPYLKYVGNLVNVWNQLSISLEWKKTYVSLNLRISWVADDNSDRKAWIWDNAGHGTHELETVKKLQRGAKRDVAREVREVCSGRRNLPITMRTAHFRLPKEQGLNMPCTIETQHCSSLEVRNLLIQLYFRERLVMGTYEVILTPKHNTINPWSWWTN